MNCVASGVHETIDFRVIGTDRRTDLIIMQIGPIGGDPYGYSKNVPLSSTWPIRPYLDSIN